MTLYTAYVAADLVALSDRPVEVGAAEHADVANAAQGTLTVNGTKVYQVVKSMNPDARLRPVIMVQFTATTDDFTINEATLEVFPCYETNTAGYFSIDGGNSEFDFVFGVEKFDLLRGIMGETDQLTKFPAAMSAKTSAQPSGGVVLADTYTYGWQVTEIKSGGVPLALRCTIKATNDSGSAKTMNSGVWIAGF